MNTPKNTPKTTTDINASRGRRYTVAQKREILDFVETHNTTHGRGGITAAAAAFHCSSLTISRWMRSAGRSTRPPSSFQAHPDAPGQLRELATIEETLAPLLARRETLRRELRL